MLLALTAGCRTAAPEPTPNECEAEETVEAEVDESVAAYPLAATAWDLGDFGPPEEPLPMLPNSRASVTYFWERYVGFDGCNWFLGVYSATTEGELTMMTPVQTFHVCGPVELDEQSATYVTNLLNVTAYQLEGEQLIASTAEGQRLITYNPATPVPVPGTEWTLAFWWSPDMNMWNPVLPTSMTTLSFGEGGEASGSGGCNNYTVSDIGNLQIEKVMEAAEGHAELPELTFGPVDSQMAECAEPEDIMDQEQGYFTTLPSVDSYFKLGGMPMMLDSEDTPLLLFSARY